MNHEIKFDALIPSEIAEKAEMAGQKKAEMNAFSMFILALLAERIHSDGRNVHDNCSCGNIKHRNKDLTGSIAFTTGLAHGVRRLLAGLVFSLGLILVVIGGAELFTGNNLIVMAWASGKVLP